MKAKKPVLSRADFLSSGSTLLNLACTGRTYGCLVKGHYYLFVGDSESGKTWLMLTLLAEAANNPEFDDYDLIYMDTEHGALMDIEKYFGAKLAKRLRILHPNHLEEMYYDIDDNIKNKPCVIIVDSTDGLNAKADIIKFQENKKAFRKGNQEKGSFGMARAKANSENLREVVSSISKNKSIVVFICQSRENAGSMGYGDKKTRAGGKALKFYASLEIWTSVREKLKKKVKGVDRKIGITCRAQVKKNRVTGKDRTVEFPIYNTFGVDDIGACVRFLVEQKHWKVSSGGIKAKELEHTAPYEELIKYIEDNDYEKELRQTVKKVWDEIEEQTVVVRKKRYE